MRSIDCLPTKTTKLMNSKLNREKVEVSIELLRSEESSSNSANTDYSDAEKRKLQRLCGGLAMAAISMDELNGCPINIFPAPNVVLS
jgi:hypothetical protein